MLSPERWIRACRRRLQSRELLLQSAGTLGRVAWIWAVFVLAAKLWWPAALSACLWTGLGLPAFVLAWTWYRGGLAVTRRDAAVWLDHSLSAGGLVIALEETPDSRWAALLPQRNQQWRSGLPRVPWWLLGRAVGWPAVFLTTVLLIPARQPAAAAVSETTLGQETARQLADLADGLDRLPIADPQEKDRLKAEIAALAEDALRGPLTREKWETVDALRQRLKFRADQASGELGNAAQVLSLLSSALQAGNGALPVDQQSQLEQQALGVLQKFATPENLSRLQSLAGQPELQQMLKEGAARLPDDPVQRQQLLQGLQQALAGETRDVDALKSLLPGGLSQAVASAAVGGALSSFLGPGTAASVKPRTGVANPPAAVRFGDAGRPTAERFRPRPPVAKPTATATTTAGAKPTGEAWTRQVSPRHRAVVKEYFQAP